MLSCLIYYYSRTRNHVGVLEGKDLLPRGLGDGLTFRLFSSTHWTNFGNWLFTLRLL